MKKYKTVVFSLGGSLVVPNEIDLSFLKKFRKFILELIKNNYKVIIVVGGGNTSKRYDLAAQKIIRIKKNDLDWLGIKATKLNAELLRCIFSEKAYPSILVNPNEKINFNKYQVYIASGWKPGCSTDKDTVLWAKKIGAKQVFNLTDVNFVYDKDPDKYSNAKPIKKINWLNFRKIVGNKWSPRSSWPFDPVASQLAQKNKLEVIILNGRNLKNLKNCLKNKKFQGTIIK